MLSCFNRVSDNTAARWTVLVIMSLIMLGGYFFTDVMSPLASMIEHSELYHWDKESYGLYASSYSWFNVFFLMLIFGGIILDKSGIRLTGNLSMSLMIIGTFTNFYAMTETFNNGGPLYNFFNSFLTDYAPSAKLAAIGFALFGTGMEIVGVIVSRVVVKWFKGKELALAMALTTAFGRMGMLIVYIVSPRMAASSGICSPIILGIIMVIIAAITFLIYCVFDKKYDKETAQLEDNNSQTPEEPFRLKDLNFFVTDKSFIFISLLCVTFYAAVFPFMKFAPDLMVNKFGVDPDVAGDIPSWLPVGTLILTPLFGFFLDKKGKGATVMILGSAILIFVHLCFAFCPANTWIAYTLMILLGIAFSLVPASMWPAVSKIVKEKYLGSAYSVIFYIQNWGLMGMPLLIGIILNSCNPGVAQALQNNQTAVYDYTVPMIAFAAAGILGLIFAFALKRADLKSGYGLDLPNKK